MTTPRIYLSNLNHGNGFSLDGMAIGNYSGISAWNAKDSYGGDALTMTSKLFAYTVMVTTTTLTLTAEDVLALSDTTNDHSIRSFDHGNTNN